MAVIVPVGIFATHRLVRARCAFDDVQGQEPDNKEHHDGRHMAKFTGRKLKNFRNQIKGNKAK
jgi:hypothetical protein